MERGGAVLLDSCAAIWLASAAPMKDEAYGAIHEAGLLASVLVSAVTAWEIGLLTRPRADGKVRLELGEPPARWLERLLARPALRPLPLSVQAALTSSSLPPPFHEDPADRLLVATARELGVPLVTRDQRILRYAEAGHLRAIAC